jgi:16S rRNA (adenine1518-N6/adenine1519-N6)-dimethyltransferase
VKVKAKKYLGQHFLIDQTIAISTAEAISYDIDNIIEVGPGMGMLSQYILKQPFKNYVAVEIDNESVDYLKINLPELNVINADFLKLNLEEIFTGKCSIVGNFPYNISTQILFKVFDNRNQVDELVGMFQHEVAQRIVSKHGNKQYGILSVLLQAFYDMEYLFKVSNTAFDPPPNVQSAVIKMTRNNVSELPCNVKLFVQIVKVGFNQRRKMLHNALKPLCVYNGTFAQKRAEQLSVDDFVLLTNEVERLASGF